MINDRGVSVLHSKREKSVLTEICMCLLDASDHGIGKCYSDVI